MTDDKLEDATIRLSVNTVAPKHVHVDDIQNNAQRRLIAYLAVFRDLFGYGRSGHRVGLPECVISKIRTTFPDSNETDETFEYLPRVYGKKRGRQ